MLLLAPLMRYVPLAALAAVLLVVAWNMSEYEHFRTTLSAPWGDRVVLLLHLASSTREPLPPDLASWARARASVRCARTSPAWRT